MSATTTKRADLLDNAVTQLLKSGPKPFFVQVSAKPKRRRQARHRKEP